MNYRHDYHAGNAADVFKHVALVALLRQLQRKEAPLSYVETHAGRGRYALTNEMAQKTGEFLRGIARLWPPGQASGPLLAEYLGLVAAQNEGPDLTCYPGSPWLARALLRPRDRMILCELRAADAQALRELFRGDARVAVHQRDGYEALGALLPPTPRRGLVLIDPPYERPDELDAAVRGLRVAKARWAEACVALWYPIKGPLAASLLHAAVLRAGLPEVLCVELSVGAARDPTVMSGSGLILVDPPWQIDQVLAAALPELARLLGGDEGRVRVDWLVGPR